MNLHSPSTLPAHLEHIWLAPPGSCHLASFCPQQTGALVKFCFAPGRCIKLKCFLTSAPCVCFNSQLMCPPNLLPGLDSIDTGRDSACRGLSDFSTQMPLGGLEIPPLHRSAPAPQIDRPASPQGKPAAAPKCPSLDGQTLWMP